MHSTSQGVARMKRRNRAKLKGRPKNLPSDPFREVRGDHLRAALKAAGLTLQATAKRLAGLGAPVSYPVLSRLMSGEQQRTRESILRNVAGLMPGISADWLTGEMDEDLDAAFENERRGELDPSHLMNFPATLTYFVECQRLANEIQEASNRDGARDLDWLSLVRLALRLNHARAQWRGKMLARVPIGEFSDYATAEARAWRLKLGAWLEGTEKLEPQQVTQRYQEIMRRLLRFDSGDGSLSALLPSLPAERVVEASGGPS